MAITVSQTPQPTWHVHDAEALPVIADGGALAAAHAAGIVHRDFKSNNVMLIDSGGSQPLRVVVTDFGLAHRMDEEGATDSTAITAAAIW
jgi:serine/threonine protein kinase